MAQGAYILNGERVTKDEYNRAKFDRFLVTVQKGVRDKIKVHAQESGKSLNAYIIGLIEADMGKLSEE